MCKKSNPVQIGHTKNPVDDETTRYILKIYFIVWSHYENRKAVSKWSESGSQAAERIPLRGRRGVHQKNRQCSGVDPDGAFLGFLAGQPDRKSTRLNSSH